MHCSDNMAETSVVDEPIAANPDANAADENLEERERAELDAYVAELTSKIDAKLALRNKNVSCVRPTEDHFTKLDSSLKKNTAFVKKMKLFTAGQLDALLKDMATLNLTKYISEVSAALGEAKLKLTDVTAAVIFCSQLHQLYGEFSGTFLENWQKSLNIKPNEKVANASKLRVDLKFFAELVSAGIFNNKLGLQLLGSALTNIIAQDKEDHSHLSIILSFCKHCGEEYAGLVPRSILCLAEVCIQLLSDTHKCLIHPPIVFHFPTEIRCNTPLFYVPHA